MLFAPPEKDSTDGEDEDIREPKDARERYDEDARERDGDDDDDADDHDDDEDAREKDDGDVRKSDTRMKIAGREIMKRNSLEWTEMEVNLMKWKLKPLTIQTTTQALHFCHH